MNSEKVSKKKNILSHANCSFNFYSNSLTFTHSYSGVICDLDKFC